jgi:hypothetical protein
MSLYEALHRSADFQVCCIAGFQTCEWLAVVRLADLEIGDTAGLETCATVRGLNAFLKRTRALHE